MSVFPSRCRSLYLSCVSPPPPTLIRHCRAFSLSSFSRRHFRLRYVSHNAPTTDNNSNNNSGGGRRRGYGRSLFVVVGLASSVLGLYYVLFSGRRSANRTSPGSVSEGGKGDVSSDFLEEKEVEEAILGHIHGGTEGFFGRIWLTICVCFRGVVLGVKFGVCALMYRVMTSSVMPRCVSDLWYKWILWCFRTSGPVAIKLGQWMSTRPDIFSSRLCEVFRVLHSGGRFHSVEESRRIVKEAFGLEMEELFDSFDEKPVGTGAIAQVHRAVLKEKYRTTKRLKEDPHVAVKIRHPGVLWEMKRDFSLLAGVARLSRTFGLFGWIDVEDKLAFFRNFLLQQMDLEREARNLVIFNRNFRSYKSVTFPEPVDGLVTQKVLVETFERGESVQLLADRKDELSLRLRKRIAYLGMTAFLKMLFEDNFLHSDLHPGNFFVRLKKDPITQRTTPIMVVLDVGLITRMPADDRSRLYAILEAWADNKGELIAEYVVEDSPNYVQYVDPETNRLDYSRMSDRERAMVKNFSKQIAELVDKVVKAPVGAIRVAPAFAEIIDCVRECGLVLNNHMVGIFLGMIVCEGIGRSLHEKVRFLTVAKRILVMSKEGRREFFARRFRSFLRSVGDGTESYEE